MSVNQTTSISLSVSACAGCHLITGNEWLTITHNLLNVASNWSSGAVGGGYIYSGHNDNAPANSLAAGVDSDSYNGTGQTSGNQRRTVVTYQERGLPRISDSGASPLRIRGLVALPGSPGTAQTVSEVFGQVGQKTGSGLFGVGAPGIMVVPQEY